LASKFSFHAHGKLFFSWVFLFVLPLFLMKAGLVTLIETSEESLRQTARQNLQEEIQAFEDDLNIRRHLTRTIAQNLNALGFIQAASRLSYSLPTGLDPYIVTHEKLASYTAGLHRDLGFAPLAVFAVGCDSRETFVLTDPQAWPRDQQPSRSVITAMMAYLLDQGNCLPLAYAYHVDALKRRWFSSARASEKIPQFFQQTFGAFILPPFPEGETREIYTNRFGEGTLFLHFQGLRQKVGSSSAVLGGVLTVFFNKTMTPDRMFQRARNSPRLPGMKRGLAKLNYPEFPRALPRFSHTPDHFMFFCPLRMDISAFPLKKGRSLAEQFQHRWGSPTQMCLPGIWAALPLERLRHSLRPLLPFFDVGTILLLALSGWGLWVFGRTESTLALPLRLKLGLALLLAVGPPLLCFWLGASIYVPLHTDFEQRQIQTRLNQNLQTLENGLRSQDSQQLQELWGVRRGLKALLNQPPEKLTAFLERWVGKGAIGGMYFLRLDGYEYSSGVLSLARETTRQGPISRETLQVMRGYIIMQLIAATHLPPQSSQAQAAQKALLNRLKANGRFDSLTESVIQTRQPHHENPQELRTMFISHGRLINSPFAAQQNFKFGFSILESPPHESPSRGILLVLFSLEKMADAYFRDLMQNPELFRSHDDKYLTRLSVYRVNAAGDQLLHDPTISLPDDDLRELAWRAFYTRRTTSFLNRRGEQDQFVATRVSTDFPFVGVAVTEPLPHASGRFWGPITAVGIMLYTLLITLATSGFLTTIFVRPLRLLITALGAVRSGHLEQRLQIATHDEFATLATAFNNMSQGLLERQRMERFLPEVVREEIRKHESPETEKPGARVFAAVLFSDIRRFTTLTEQHPAPDIVSLLNTYFQAMEPAILQHEGQINKFIGDAILAVFFVIPDLENPAIRACRAALNLRRNLEQFNRRREEAGFFPIDNGVGIAYGTVVSGTVGSRRGRLDFTIVGDIVQTAGQLEAASKHGTASRVMISAECQAELGGALPTRPFALEQEESRLAGFELESLS
jgi:class 3 adenylate cyclase